MDTSKQTGAHVIADPKTEGMRIVDNITENLNRGVRYFTLENRKPLTTLVTILEEARVNGGWLCAQLDPTVVAALDNAR